MMKKSILALILVITLLVGITPIGAFAATDKQLSELKFTQGTSKTSQVHTLIPAFDPNTTEYTLVVPDSTSSVAMWATLSTSSSGTIKASYTKTNNTAANVTVTSGKTSGTSLSTLVSASKLAGNTVNVTIGGEIAYTINIVRQATLNKLSIKIGESDVTLSPTFNSTKYEYTAAIPSDATLTVTPAVKSSGSTYTINGATETEIKPQWNGLNASLEIKVKGNATSKDSNYTVALSQLAEEIEIVTPPTKTAYSAGETFDATGLTIKATYSDDSFKLIGAENITIDPAGSIYPNTNEVSIIFEGQIAKQPISVAKVFDGSGTETEPYLIKTADDLLILSNLVSSGLSFEGKYFKMVNDITLPDSEGTDAWVPLGIDKTKPFSGIFDGNSKLITVPEGGLPLIGFPANASLSNLNVYGSKIAGYGVVNGYAVGNTNVPAIAIDNVTLKSGTKTLKAGFIGGYASGSNTITIKNSTIEKGVTIGYDKDQKWIGSFGGEFNGTIENCVSYATVYGTDFVGGIVSNKGQSMGDFDILNCKFYGDVIATGNYVGGIVGHGYGGTGWGFTPNTPVATVKDCICTGSVTGADYVGGIIGADAGVAQAWENGIGYIQNNYFFGKVTATNGNYVGGITGYYRSLNKFTIFNDNYFVADCGAEKGIGGVEFIDTNNTSHETASGITYFNTENDTTGCPTVQYCSWKKGHNRTDDPLGVDADKLAKKIDSSIVTAIEKIDSIGKVTLKSGEAIKLARTAYDALNDNDKAHVLNYTILTKAEKDYEALVKAEEDKINDTTTPDHSENIISPDTGDHSNISFYVVIMFCSVIALAVVIIKAYKFNSSK